VYFTHFFSFWHANRPTQPRLEERKKERKKRLATLVGQRVRQAFPRIAQSNPSEKAFHTTISNANSFFCHFSVSQLLAFWSFLYVSTIEYPPDRTFFSPES